MQTNAARGPIGGLDGLIGDSHPMAAFKDAMRRLLEAEARVLPSERPSVLLSGETGTGKEMAARALHLDGGGGSFVRLDCATSSQELASLAAREKGTLFLDEVGELPMAVQSQLLALFDGGGVCRVVSSTHRDLDHLVRVGRFRADLLYRLRVVALRLPPLRARGEDVLRLASHFVALHGERYGKGALRFSREAARALRAHPWPGNVRELRNLLEHAVRLACGDAIELEHIGCGLTESVRRPDAGRRASCAVSRTRLLAAIDEAGWNVTRAAEMLGISRDTLRYRIRKMGLVRAG